METRADDFYPTRLERPTESLSARTLWCTAKYRNELMDH